MKINLTHSFFKNTVVAKSLYTDVSKSGTWISRVVRIAEKIEKDPKSVPFISTKIEPKDIANDFRGAAFEGFGEALIKLMGSIPQIGIYDYEPYTGPDYGVDGVGKGKNGKIATVQFKFRGEFDKVLTSKDDHLGNFVSASLEKPFEVSIDDNENMLILTTGKEVFYKDMSIEWKNKVKYIAQNQSWGCFRGQKYKPEDPTNTFSLKSLVDNNLAFWNQVYESV